MWIPEPHKPSKFYYDCCGMIGKPETAKDDDRLSTTYRISHLLLPAIDCITVIGEDYAIEYGDSDMHI